MGDNPKDDQDIADRIMGRLVRTPPKPHKDGKPKRRIREPRIKKPESE